MYQEEKPINELKILAMYVRLKLIIFNLNPTAKNNSNSLKY